MKDDSKYCDKCGTKLREDAEFCEECGKKIVRIAKKKSLDEIELEVKEKVDAEFSARQEAEFRKQKEKELRDQKEWEIQEKKRQKLAKQQAEIDAAERRRLEQIEKEKRKEQELREKRRREQKEHFYAVLRKKKTQKILAVFLVIILFVLIVPYAVIQIMTMQENQRLAEEAKRAAEEAKKIAEENMLDKNASAQLWLKTYGGAEKYYQQSDSTLGLTSDGGYIITGTNISDNDRYSVLLIKTDADGTEQWNKTFGNGLGEFVQQTKDGGYVIAGYDPSNGMRSLLIKTDANGTEQWNRTYSGTAIDGAQTDDGGYIITSDIYDSTNGYSALLIKTDANGTEQWNKALGSGHFSSIQQTKDGGYILAGTNTTRLPEEYHNGITFRPFMGGWLFKTDSNGNKQWDKTFKNEGFSSVKQTSDGGYIIASNTDKETDYIMNENRISLIKTDSEGNQQWYYFVQELGTSRSKCVIQTKDGGYIVGGAENFIKIDDDGNKKWDQTYSSELYISTFLQTADGGHIISGSSHVSDTNHNIFLLKTVGRK